MFSAVRPTNPIKCLSIFMPSLLFSFLINWDFFWGGGGWEGSGKISSCVHPVKEPLF
jgi:hypothetical protein